MMFELKQKIRIHLSDQLVNTHCSVWLRRSCKLKINLILLQNVLVRRHSIGSPVYMKEFLEAQVQYTFIPQTRYE